MRLLVSGCTATLRRVWPDHRGVLGALRTPRGSYAHVAELGMPWAGDNGAFAGLDEPAFRRMLARLKGLTPRGLFVAVPDVVADHRATLASWSRWRDEVADAGHPLAFVGQDGATGGELPWPDMGGYFVGGSTAWKLSRASAALVAEAKGRGLWVHCGRVNSLRRLRAAYDLGCDSVDGTGMSKWGDCHLEKFCRWVHQLRSQPTLYHRG